MTHKCWITTCEVQVPRRMLGCAPHWAKVPKGLQERVYATLRRRKQDGWGPWLAAIEAARHAVEEAL